MDRRIESNELSAAVVCDGIVRASGQAFNALYADVATRTATAAIG